MEINTCNVHIKKLGSLFSLGKYKFNMLEELSKEYEEKAPSGLTPRQMRQLLKHLYKLCDVILVKSHKDAVTYQRQHYARKQITKLVNLIENEKLRKTIQKKTEFIIGK